MRIDELVALRHDLHAHPETRFEEFRTSDVVTDRLRALGYEPVRGLAGTGVVATLRGAAPGPSVLLRADMDALPILERTGRAYASTVEGKMHACGHDGHMVMLLGAAEALASAPPERGTLHFCFQPAEEGGAGAQVMIDDGLFEQFPTDRCFGLHNWPGLSRGRLAVRSGPVMAGGWRLRITVMGRGSHAAQPHLSIDPITIGAAFIQEAQLLISRRSNPLIPAVLSLCTFDAGSADNVIPDRAVITGTIRALDQTVLDTLRDALVVLGEGMGRSHGATITVESMTPYPVTINTPAETDLVRGLMRQMDGEGFDDAIMDVPPSMASEDFAYMLNRKPGVYAMIGNGDSAALHAPEYDFDDAVIERGVDYWVRLAHHALAAA
ncbi:amidohydrolase [Ameyamaea chiangmaiensis NBRC 103196]|uniref:Amidohydrolase n=1 Tax=Ameyamaea chiangmaiensis TaxID=442969 RepID=A0A850PAL6_9PROT|nr:amidohydrolase [Ameyamaea chiangmaiensis]MBS4075975.1 amidohydrolase [Ameyamaea chiangmaiensis]NVN39739.1 amidohydrolase [Ameyamaea chiangmaiensis]GBQ61564.1 amidohydrolase [Ameyamaea chiangmaiensis NBRC 103196]